MAGNMEESRTADEGGGESAGDGSHSGAAGRSEGGALQEHCVLVVFYVVVIFVGETRGGVVGFERCECL